jgi:CHAD domain-containing protein
MILVMSRRTCPQAPLCSYADPLIEDLKRLVPAALKRWDEEAIHDSRVATRRLRAALDLIEPMIAEKSVTELRKTLRRLRRRLGPLRDLDVMLEHLRPLLDHRRHGAAAKWLSEQLQAERDAARRSVQRKAPPGRWIDRLDVWDALRQPVIALGDEIQRRLRGSLQTQWHAFAQQADGLAAHMLDGPPQRSPLDAHDPHELRIAGKTLRYTFEMLAKTRHRLPAAVGRTFKRMQSELGLWHDHVVLAEATMRQSLDRLLAHHDPDLQAQVLALSTAMLRTAERHLRRFAKLWRAKGAALAQVVEGLGSAAAVRSRQKGPGLFDSTSASTPAMPPPDESSAA